jgi:membrane associated rhomboid family serine protease
MKQPVTKIFVAINVLVHLYVWWYVQGTQGPQAADALIDRFGLTPAEFRNGAFWQPLTALFLHDGRVFPIIHIGFNMLAIWSFGLALENTLGSIRFAWLMFVSGCASSLFVILFQADLPNPTIGASGIVLGLLGALAVFYPNSQMLIFFIPMRARNAAILIGVLSIVLPMFGVLTFISHMGHLGGLVGGVLYSWFALGLRFGPG